LLEAAQQRGDWPVVAATQKLLAEHEMGELFKVLGLLKGAADFGSLGFVAGDRSHRL
jgi:SAM-dependent MidA family methyltransferase